MKISQTEVYEVASFYHHFDIVKEGDEPPPALTVRVCESVSCSLFGSEQLISSLQAEYGDSVRIQPVPCVGRCESAPVAVVGQLPIAHATTEKVIECVNAGTTTHHPDPYIGYEQYLAEGGYATYKACRANHDVGVGFCVLKHQLNNLSALLTWRVTTGNPIIHQLIKFNAQMQVQRLGHTLFSTEVIIDGPDADIRQTLDLMY